MDGDAAADTSPTPKQECKSRSDESNGTEEEAEKTAPPPKKTNDRPRGVKRAPAPEGDPSGSPTATRSRRRQTISSEAPPETEEGAVSKDREIRRLQKELADQKLQMQSQAALAKIGRDLLAEKMVELAKIEREKEKTRLFHEAIRVGSQRLSPIGQSDGSWVGGTEQEAIDFLREKLRKERQAMETERKSVQKQMKKAMETEDTENVATEDPDEFMEAREVCNHRAEYIRREEAALKDREHRLSADRELYQRKHILCNIQQEGSAFKNYPKLDKGRTDGRFQLLNMLGKGGQSEIYKAFDLEQMCFCAIKIHETAKFSEEKARYMRYRAEQELKIHRDLQHPRIVQLREYFHIETAASTVFAMVLELCEGETLDMRLKMHGPLPEKEAKSIIVQILNGLRYLHTAAAGRKKIVHYDIKPANLFYHAGQVKIGDFGLSKIDDSTDGMIELSCVGNGTPHYLPPECHETTSLQLASSKVDVWSTGVVFFELLFGRRPFGNGQHGEAFRRQTAVEGTFEIVFPTSPKVSAEAREFLRRLLARDREQRLDVPGALRDPYIRKTCTDQSARARK